jgi:hypothetical protein
MGSNLLLANNNLLLITKNRSLTELSQQLMGQVTTLEKKSNQLQTLVDSSIITITDAQKEAKKLELQNKILKISLYGTTITIAGIAIYLGGEAFHLWK